MKYGIYAIRDLKTGFLTPTIDQNNASAMRNFEHACMNIDSLFYSHPDDYSLFYLGDYDTDRGEISLVDTNVFLCSATDFVRK